MNDEAKAVEESAKTLGKGIDLAREFGGFIAPLVKGSLEDGIGIFEDKLKYMRWERQIRLIKRSHEFMIANGVDKITRPLPLKYAVPLLQGASLEDDDDLQDMWAKLLANAVNNDCIELKRIYIDILERLSPLEGKIIDKIYSLPFEEIQHKALQTSGLPFEIFIDNKEVKQSYTPLNDPEIELALINLDRLGCISCKKTFWTGNDTYSSITPTLLGKYFYEACSLKPKIKE